MDDGTCQIGGCEKPRYQRRPWCGSHTMKIHRYGDPHHKPAPRWADLTGQRFGFLVAQERTDAGLWECRCDCGRLTIVRVGDLRRGSIRTCATPSVHLQQRVAYAGAHDRVERAYGLAKSHQCVDCGGQAQEWSYDHNDPSELTEQLGRYLVAYSGKPQHYQARCVTCHRRFDRALKRSITA